MIPLPSNDTNCAFLQEFLHFPPVGRQRRALCCHRGPPAGGGGCAGGGQRRQDCGVLVRCGGKRQDFAGTEQILTLQCTD